MKLRDPPQPIDRLLDRGELSAPLGYELLHRPIEDRMQDLVLALEVKINGPVRDSGLARNICDLGAKVTAPGKDLCRRTEDRFAFIRWHLAGCRPFCSGFL